MPSPCRTTSPPSPTTNTIRRVNRAWGLLAVICLLLFLPRELPAKPPEVRREVQRHGVVFEQWIRETFFGGYQPADYTQRWD